MDEKTESLLLQTEEEELSPEKPSPPESVAASSKEAAGVNKTPGSSPTSATQEFSRATECSVDIPHPPAAVSSKVESSSSPASEHTPLILDIPERVQRVEAFNTGSASPSDQRMCLPCCETDCCYGFQRFADMFFSPLTLPYYFLLLSLPIATGYMSLWYMLDCPVAQNVPILLFLLALCGIVYVAGRIAEIIYYWFLPNQSAWSLQSFFYVFILGTMMVLIITELVIILPKHPDFENVESKDYCHPLFYNFCYYGGLAGLFLVGFSCSLILPTVMCS